MTSVNSISTVDICADCVTLALVCAKDICLMRTCVRPQNSIFVDVVSICTAPARVICGEAKGIKILSYGDDRKDIVVVLVSRSRKSGFYEFSRYRDRVIGLVM